MIDEETVKSGMMNMDTEFGIYEDAVRLATEKHRGQTRIGGGEYITHPLAVAAMFEDEDHKIVAVLHDIVEDTDVTVFELDLDYNFKPALCNAVEVLSRMYGESY